MRGEREREAEGLRNVDVTAPDWLMDAAMALVFAMVVGVVAGAVIRAAGLRWTVGLAGAPVALAAGSVDALAGAFAWTATAAGRRRPPSASARVSRGY